MKLTIKQGDKVKVIAGSNKGQTGSVLEIDKNRLKIRVKDVHVQTLFDKKESTQKKREGFIDYSNVKLVEAVAKDKSKKKSKKQ